MNPLIVISTDSHIGAMTVADYSEYLDPKYRYLIPELVASEESFVVDRATGLSKLREITDADHPDRIALVDDRERIRSGGLTGFWDLDRRLQELDGEGVAAEVVYMSGAESLTLFNYNFNECFAPDVRWAGGRAYHRWLVDKIAPAKGRVIGTADPGPCLDMEDTIAELRSVARHGFRATFAPGHISDPNLPPLTDPRYYERYWAACSDMGIVLTAHIGYGTPQGRMSKVFIELLRMKRELEANRQGGAGPQQTDEHENREKMKTLIDADTPDSPLGVDLGPRRAIWQLILGGVFDRYPNLKLNVAENHGDWVPEFKSHLDDRFLNFKQRPKLEMKPSEYFGRNVFITPTSPRRLEVQRRHEIGVDAFMFGTDYPHPEGTWPNTLDWLRAGFFDVQEDELRAMVGENAIRVYGLDRTWLSAIAARIAPAPSDILGNHPVDDRLIREFDHRAGFLNCTPPLDQEITERVLAEDLALTAA